MQLGEGSLNVPQVTRIYAIGVDGTCMFGKKTELNEENEEVQVHTTWALRLDA